MDVEEEEKDDEKLVALPEISAFFVQDVQVLQFVNDQQ